MVGFQALLAHHLGLRGANFLTNGLLETGCYEGDQISCSTNSMFGLVDGDTTTVKGPMCPFNLSLTLYDVYNDTDQDVDYVSPSCEDVASLLATVNSPLHKKLVGNAGALEPPPGWDERFSRDPRLQAERDHGARPDGLGNDGAKRHRRVLRDSIQGIDKAALDAVMRRAGVIGASGLIYEESRYVLKTWMESVIRDAVAGTDHGRRRVVTAADVTAALQRTSHSGGAALYGFGVPGVPLALFPEQIYKVLKQVHPDTKIGSTAMAVMGDFVSDTLVRLVTMAAQLPQPHHDDAEDDDDAETFRLVESPVQDPANDTDYGVVATMVETSTVADAGDGPPFSPELPVLKKLIDSRAVQTAVRMVLPGELAKHAVSEGTKAVTKWTWTNGGQFSNRMSASAGLHFNVPALAAIVSAQSKVLLTGGAAVYLAAVLEYLSAEMLELSGNAARDIKTDTINSRHLMLACRNDEELNKLMAGVVIREGGVMPNIHTVCLLPAEGRGSAYVENDKIDEQIAEQRQLAAAAVRMGNDGAEGAAHKKIASLKKANLMSKKPAAEAEGADEEPKSFGIVFDEMLLAAPGHVRRSPLLRIAT